jgi:DNA-binding NarL/FixJ family response regulator
VNSLTVLLVDDDELMRAGLRAVLSTDDSIAVTGEAATGRQAIDQAGRLRPKLVLMDVRMPDLDGISATRAVIGENPDARVLILTTFEDDDYLFGALHAGASGFLLKRAAPEELLAAIHTVAAGDSLLAPTVTRRVIDRAVRSGAPPAPATIRLMDRLTARERDVLELVAAGLSNTEISATLVIEEPTVKSHVKHILAKLDLRDRVQAVVLAYEVGLARPGRPSRPSARVVTPSG